MRWIPVQPYRCSNCNFVVQVEGLAPDVCDNCGERADKNVIVLHVDNNIDGERGPIANCTVKQGRRQMLHEWLQLVVQRGGSSMGTVRISSLMGNPDNRNAVALYYHGLLLKHGDLLMAEVPG